MTADKPKRLVSFDIPASPGVDPRKLAKRPVAVLRAQVVGCPMGSFAGRGFGHGWVGCCEQREWKRGKVESGQCRVCAQT